MPGIERAGGKVFTRACVESIVIEEGRAVGVQVKRQSGQVDVIRAPVVISGAGLHNTWTRLVPQPISEAAGMLPAAQNLKPSVGHVCVVSPNIKLASAEQNKSRSSRSIVVGLH